MNYFENDFALPIILGNSKEAIRAAKKLQKKTELEIHVLAKSLSLVGRLRFYFHKLYSSSDEIVLITAEDLARGFEEYYTPILIYCEAEFGDLVKRHSDRIEATFITVVASDVEKLLKGEKTNENI